MNHRCVRASSRETENHALTITHPIQLDGSWRGCHNVKGPWSTSNTPCSAPLGSLILRHTLPFPAPAILTYDTVWAEWGFDMPPRMFSIKCAITFLWGAPAWMLGRAGCSCSVLCKQIKLVQSSSDGSRSHNIPSYNLTLILERWNLQTLIAGCCKSFSVQNPKAIFR